MAVPQSPSFSSLLKRYRRAAGLTQEAFSARAGYSVVYISMLERGMRTPLAATVEILADALQLAPHERGLFRSAALTSERAGAASRRHPTPPTPAANTAIQPMGRARGLGLG